MEAQTNVLDAVVKAMLAVAQAILMNMPTGSHLSRGAQAAEPESFDEGRDRAEQFVQSIHSHNAAQHICR